MPTWPTELATAVLDSLYKTADYDETGRFSPNQVCESDCLELSWPAPQDITVGKKKQGRNRKQEVIS